MVNYLEQKYFVINPTDTFQWFFGTNLIARATNYFLTLTDVASNEVGSYSVVVSNPAGSAQSSNVTLFVGQPPSIVSQPQNVAVLPGGNVTFSVTATGTALTYQWLENNVDIAGQTNSTLVLTNVSSQDRGTYAVVVSNAFGSLQSHPVTFAFITLPTIVEQPQNPQILT